MWILWCLRLQNKDMKFMHTTWTLYCINIVYIEILSMLTSRKYRQCWRCILNIGSTSSTSRCLQCWRQKEYKQCQQHKLINFMNRRLKSQVPWYSDKNACHSHLLYMYWLWKIWAHEKHQSLSTVTQCAPTAATRCCLLIH